MKFFLYHFKNGFVGSFILAAAIMVAIYFTAIDFINHEGQFNLKNSKK